MNNTAARDTPPEARALHHKLDEAVRYYLRDPSIALLRGEASSLPARPVVLDANRLRGELRTMARSSHDTALGTLSRVGFLRLFAAPHVLQEVEEYIESWALQTGTPIGAYRDAWATRLRPLVTEVSFSAELLTPDERFRIAQLSQPAPLGDPDDVPTAVAAMILAAPLLSADRKPLIAVYGPAVDLAVHHAYVDALFAGGRLYALSQWGRSSLTATYFVGAASVGGVRALSSRLGPLPLALGAAAAGLWTLSNRDGHRWTKLRPAAASLREGILELSVFYAEADSAYRQLEAPLVHDLHELPRALQTAREAARETALQRAADASIGRSATPSPDLCPVSGVGRA